MCNLPARFRVRGNSYAKSYAFPWYSRASRQEVTILSPLIEDAALHYSIDEDMLKAVVWMETTHGWYDHWVKTPKTIRPMNVYLDYWCGLGVTRGDLCAPGTNIAVGTFILAQIKMRLDDPAPEKIATLYNQLGANQVSDYGATVVEYALLRPWLNRGRDAPAKSSMMPKAGRAGQGGLLDDWRSRGRGSWACWCCSWSMADLSQSTKAVAPADEVG